MKRICFVLLAVCLLLLCACKETPSVLSSDTTVKTTVADTAQDQQPPVMLLDGIHTVSATTYQWSRMENGKVSKRFVDAPHPYRYFSEKHPMLFAKTGKKNAVSFTCETDVAPKEVKVQAYKMSEESQKAIPITVETKQKKGTLVYTFNLPDDDFYAYTVTLYWDRYDGTDHAIYPFYSKVQE